MFGHHQGEDVDSDDDYVTIDRPYGAPDLLDAYVGEVRYILWEIMLY